MTTRCTIFGMMKLVQTSAIGGVVDVRIGRRRAVLDEVEQAGEDRVVAVEGLELRLVLQHRPVDGDVEIGVHELGLRRCSISALAASGFWLAFGIGAQLRR